MSRGGFRGRGRGGPPGMPAFNTRDYTEAMQKINKHGGMLYPPLDSDQVAYMTEPSRMEGKAAAYATEIQEVMSGGYNEMGTPWRLATERKSVGIEIESYSDRNKPPASSGPSKLDPVMLHMDASLFPPGLWKEYFEGQAATDKKQKARKRRKLNDEDNDVDAKEEDVSSEESVDDDFDFDDDEGSDHQDYDANYFDNGEGDDDSGGEEEENNNGGGGGDD